MQALSDQIIVSASDLNGYLACRHLTRLDLAYARGESELIPAYGADAELLFRRGDEHEASYLRSLKERGLGVVEIPDTDRTLESLEATTRATEEAMRGGAEVVYQAAFLRGGMRGHADFLFRVDRPSELGEWSYEVGDTKLARSPKPYHLLQLCFYSELLHAVQGGNPPELVHVILGTGERRSFRLAEFSAYFRRLKARFLAELEDDRRDTYPMPVEHCAVCRWRDVCDARREADDHLSLVAGMRRDQIARLERAGIATLAELGSRGPDLEVEGIGGETLERLREQASLQLAGRIGEEPRYRLLEPQLGRGFARLPRPSEGDVFFDMEGYPFIEDGLEYLFGVVMIEAGEPRFEAIWGTDRGEEKEAFERFVDLLIARRARYPELRVYHYAQYELTA